MILKGSQRGGARQLAEHLLNDIDNDHVELSEIRGFVASDLRGALAETHAISKGTRCKQFLFSLSLNPPKGVDPTEESLRAAADAAGERLGLALQPRALVIHEKEGRRHAHVVWSRIDPETMKAINLPFFKRKLVSLSRELFLEHGWTLPNGLRRDGGKSPLNFTLVEWQQAKRQKLDPQEIKQSFLDAWSRSDGAKAFANALAERGYFLARGDQRGFVAVDIHGEVYAVSRWCGVKTKEVKLKLGDASALPGLEQVQADIDLKVTDKLHGLVDDLNTFHARQTAPVSDEKKAVLERQRAERRALKEAQDKRLKAERLQRSARLHTGLRGLWQKLTGQARAIRQQNARAETALLSAITAERHTLFTDQRRERAPVQQRLDEMRRRHTRDRRLLAIEIAARARTKTFTRDATAERDQRSRERHPGQFPDLSR